MSNFGVVIQIAVMEEIGNGGGSNGSKGVGRARATALEKRRVKGRRARVKNEWRNGGGRGPLSPS